MRYLSLEWIEAMQLHIASNESMAELAHSHRIGITQVVTDGPEGNVVYHFQVGDGEASFGAGPAPREDVRFEQSWQSAVEVATHVVPAQEFFIKGQIRVSGNTQLIVESVPVFTALDTAFESVRVQTTYE